MFSFFPFRNRKSSLSDGSARTSHYRKSLRIENLEERALLSVSPVEYEALCASYSALNLPQDSSDVNLIEIPSDQLSATNLKDAITAASQTASDDLIVVRTTSENHTIQFASAADTLTINIDSSAFGALTLDANHLNRVLTVTGENTVLGLGNMVITGGQIASTAETSAQGAGIFIDSAAVTMTDCLITGNEALDYLNTEAHSGALNQYYFQNQDMASTVVAGIAGKIATEPARTFIQRLPLLPKRYEPTRFARVPMWATITAIFGLAILRPTKRERTVFTHNRTISLTSGWIWTTAELSKALSESFPATSVPVREPQL